jgi:hypothetical protein
MMIKKLKIGMTGRITFKAKKYNEWITRTFAWDKKCMETPKYIIYFDTSPGVNNYRCATKPAHVMINYKQGAA